MSNKRSENKIEFLFFVIVAIVLCVALWRLEEIPIRVIKVIAIGTLLIYVLERLGKSLQDSSTVKQHFQNYLKQSQERMK